MSERVVAVDVGVVWEPNVPNAVLVADDDGGARLWLSARWDDPDQRAVVLAWNGARLARMEPPNDDARRGHRLYEHGLADDLWLGEVFESSLVAQLETVNRVHPFHDPGRWLRLRHWVVPLKGCTVEVVADSVEVERRDRTR
jgi:hypothetical protein